MTGWWRIQLYQFRRLIRDSRLTLSPKNKEREEIFMIKKLALTTGLAVCAAASTSAFAGGDCGGIENVGQNLSGLDSFYYNGGHADGATDSGIPHLPAAYGHMQTNDTYRFFNVNDMVATMIGEGKHGMWRYQDNGTVREYLTVSNGNANGHGLDEGTDVLSNDPNVLNAIDHQYSHHDAAASWSAYRADGNQIKDGKLQYVDLPINHPKYDGDYVDHAPIDLAAYYCTMSGPEYPNAQAAVRLAFGQSGANQVGPLGERAGLDIKENYLNVLRLNLLPDARAWVNVSGSTEVIDYKAVDAEETPFEVYLVERPFFNEEYLFYVVVFGDDSSSYIRPEGAYYEHLMAREAGGEDLPDFSTSLNHSPTFTLEEGGTTEVTPVNLFGTHHPGGEGVTIPNGACPAMGGDYGASYYGAAWPNNYQEVTPLCDAVMLDIKAYANLDGATWNDPGKYLANATVDGQQNAGDHDGDGDAASRGYVDNAGEYGTFTDSYLDGETNPEAFTATGTQSKTFVEVQEAVSAEEPLPFEPSL